MTQRAFLCAAGAVLVAASAHAQASAQARPQTTTPARPAGATGPAVPAVAPQVRPSATPSNPGPVIPGVCVLDGQAAIRDSAAGRAAAARMTTLGQQVRAELQAEQTAITNEGNAVRALPEAQRETRAAALQTRFNAYQRTAQIREEELRRTQAQALDRIVNALEPVVLQLYVQRGCGLMLDRGSIVYANPAMDVTAAAQQGLDRALPTITFDRVRLPAQQTGAAAPAPRPR